MRTNYALACTLTNTPTILRFLLRVLTLLTLHHSRPTLFHPQHHKHTYIHTYTTAAFHPSALCCTCVVLCRLRTCPIPYLHDCRQATVPTRSEESLRCGTQRGRSHSVRSRRLSAARNVQMVIQQHRRNAGHAAEWIRKALAAGVETDLHPD